MDRTLRAAEQLGQTTDIRSTSELVEFTIKTAAADASRLGVSGKSGARAWNL